ncbi:MAG: hypothetical protein HKO57_12955 [Akkermansiaceae bacterium]|nr:hypothetical protein [Akkermansiaceae bacterium]
MMRNGRIFWHDPKVDPAAQAYDALNVIKQVEKEERRAMAGASTSDGRPGR